MKQCTKHCSTGIRIYKCGKSFVKKLPVEALFSQCLVFTSKKFSPVIRNYFINNFNCKSFGPSFLCSAVLHFLIVSLVRSLVHSQVTKRRLVWNALFQLFLPPFTTRSLAPLAKYSCSHSLVSEQSLVV
ncbi:hypothetical protein ACLKA7_014980 [Drosophila subpalustris]